jgi:hypothetical protein
MDGTIGLKRVNPKLELNENKEKKRKEEKNHENRVL